MSSERLRVHRSTREKLRRLAKDSGETYSGTLDRILPETIEEGHVLSETEADMVVLSVSPEIHERVNALAGDSVPVRRVIDYYLLRYEMAEIGVAYDLLDGVFHRRKN